MNDYYHILEIPRDSDLDQIKKAYRKLAVKYHTDKNPYTAEKFHQISEAYGILKDPEKRKKYDNQTVVSSGARIRRGGDVTIKLKVTQDEILSEIIKNVITTRNTRCPTCLGTGSKTKMTLKCPECNGSGIDIISAVVGPRKFCATCKGYGMIPKDRECFKCNGTGLIKENFQCSIQLNRENQNRIIMQNLGSLPQNNGSPGDLIIDLEVQKKSLFEISGKDIKGNLYISPAQAVLGDVIFLEVFGNMVKFTIPAGTKPGIIIEEKSAGINKKGSLKLKIFFNIPTRLSDEEKKLYTQLLKLQKGFL